jgi:hypothetical protein
VSGSTGVLGRAGSGSARGERRREALVERLHGDIDDRAKGLDERSGLLDLRAALTAQSQREPDDDALGSLLGDELREPP